jgi:hypothetical protein
MANTYLPRALRFAMSFWRGPRQNDVLQLASQKVTTKNLGSRQS